MLPGIYSTTGPTLFGLPLHGLLSDRAGYQYPSAMSLSPLVTDQSGNVVGLTAPGIVRSTAQGLLQGITAPNQVRQGKLDPMTGAMLTAGAAPVGGLLARAPAGAVGMNVFHGTPHKFAPEPGFPQGRPRLDKMGTGEGAQAYGPGFYSAEADDEATAFMRAGKTRALDPRQSPYVLAKAALARFENDADAAVAELQALRDRSQGHMFRAKLARAIEGIKNREEGFSDNLYKLDIPDADAAKLLDYDAPISQQPKVVQDAIDRLGFMPDDPDKVAGGDVWYRMRRQLGEDEAAAAMRGAGVPGLRYKDAGSRGTDSASGTRNFVVWDQDVLDRTQMLQRNDETLFSNAKPAAVAGGLLNQAAQSDARRITVPEDRQGLIWTPMSAGEKSVSGGELSKTAPLVDAADMSATVVPTGDLLPRKIVQPEDLQGSILSPAIGDRTAAGGLLTEINDAPLANPVLLEGGPDFMRGPASQADDVIWASNQSPMTKLSNQAQELGETGKDINFVYTASGGRNADFSTMMSDALVEQLPAAKVTKKTKQSFDREMKVADKNWPGIDSPKLGEYLRNSTGDRRKAFVEKIALGKYQKAGMPDIVSTRFAITEPELLGLPTGVSGYAISRMDPSGRLVTDPTVPHTTYPVQLGGKGYVGGLLDQVPREVMFPDFYATRRAAGIPTRGDDRSFMSRKVYQDANQQWLDNVMQYLQGIQRAN